MTRRRGFTLPEVLVAAFLLALLFGILVRFFQITYRISGEELERNSAEATLLNLTTKLRRDLSAAAPAGLSLLANGETLLIHPVTLTDVGTVAYQNKLVLWYYNPATRIVSRKQTDSYSGFVFDGTPFRATQAVLAGLGTSSEFWETLKVPNVSTFQLTTNPDVGSPFIGSPISLDLTIRLNRSDKSIDYSEVIHLRNAGS